MNNPKLIEPGAKYFFDETLKRCRMTKYNYFNRIYNVCLTILFVLVIGSILYCTYKTKNNEYMQKQRTLQQELYIASKIKKIKQAQRRERGQMITNIPEFEDNQHNQSKNFL